MDPLSNSFNPPDLSYLNEIAGGNNEMITEIFRIFEQEASADLIKLRAQLANGEALAAGQTAHKIKGSLLSLGAVELKDLFLEIEKLGKGSGDLDRMRAIFVEAEQDMNALFTWARKNFTL